MKIFITVENRDSMHAITEVIRSAKKVQGRTKVYLTNYGKYDYELAYAVEADGIMKLVPADMREEAELS